MNNSINTKQQHQQKQQQQQQGFSVRAYTTKFRTLCVSDQEDFGSDFFFRKNTHTASNSLDAT
jgi:outer membrane biogenesis lipoprotein LolB